MTQMERPTPSVVLWMTSSWPVAWPWATKPRSRSSCSGRRPRCSGCVTGSWDAVEEAEDAVQETFVLAYRALDSYRGDGPPGAWVARIAVRECWRRHKAAVRRAARTTALDEVVMDTTADPTDVAREVVNAEERAEIRRAVEALPEPYRETVSLRFFGDLSPADIAAGHRATGGDGPDTPPSGARAAPDPYPGRGPMNGAGSGSPQVPGGPGRDPRATAQANAEALAWYVASIDVTPPDDLAGSRVGARPSGAPTDPARSAARGPRVTLTQPHPQRVRAQPRRGSRSHGQPRPWCAPRRSRSWPCSCCRSVRWAPRVRSSCVTPSTADPRRPRSATSTPARRSSPSPTPSTDAAGHAATHADAAGHRPRSCPSGRTAPRAPGPPGRRHRAATGAPSPERTDRPRPTHAPTGRRGRAPPPSRTRPRSRDRPPRPTGRPKPRRTPKADRTPRPGPGPRGRRAAGTPADQGIRRRTVRTLPHLSRTPAGTQRRWGVRIPGATSPLPSAILDDATPMDRPREPGEEDERA